MERSCVEQVREAARTWARHETLVEIRETVPIEADLVPFFDRIDAAAGLPPQPVAWAGRCPCPEAEGAVGATGATGVEDGDLVDDCELRRTAERQGREAGVREAIAEADAVVESLEWSDPDFRGVAVTVIFGAQLRRI